MSFFKKTAIAAGLLLGSTFAFAQDAKVVEMNIVNENGIAESIGMITLTDSEYGLVFTPDLKGVPAGVHGFHMHTNPNCGPDGADNKKGPGLAAGGHYDPQGTGKHGTPWGDGHKGDLPALYVNADGSVTTPVLAPRLKLADAANRALMIHVGGDNHSDHPAPLGGGGARMACGVVK